MKVICHSYRHKLKVLWTPWVAMLALLCPSVAGVTYFHGMCDASAAVPLGSRYELVADDEDNALRLFDMTQGGAALWSMDLSTFLEVDRAEPEVDLEAAARVGDIIYWISSHGRSSRGQPRPSRHRFFATRIVERDGVPSVEPVGKPYKNLLADLLADPRLREFNLASAAQRAPKSAGALNIEGLVGLRDGRLLIGFRNPQPGGRALVVPLENPGAVIEGERARLGTPILLDLGGRGVRGMGGDDERILVIAGSHREDVRPQIFEWAMADGSLRSRPEFDLSRLNPESVEIVGDNQAEALLVVSDDGTVRVGRKECKKLKNPAQKRFRAALLRPVE